MESFAAQYEVIVGVLLPLVIAFFIREEWDQRLKIGISFVIVLAVSLGHAFYAGMWNIADIGRSILTVLVLTVSTYKGFWLGTGATDWIEKNLGLTNKEKGDKP